MRKKIISVALKNLCLSIFFLLCLSSPIFAQIPAPSLVTCTLTTNPSPVNTTHKNINITIQTAGLDENQTYTGYLEESVSFGKTYPWTIRDSTGSPYPLSVTSGVISIQNMDAQGRLFSQAPEAFSAKTYKLIVGNGEIPGASRHFRYCAVDLPVQQATSGGSRCSIQFDNSSFSSQDDIIFKLDTDYSSSTEQRRYIFKKGGRNGTDLKVDCPQIPQLLNGINLGKLQDSQYFLEIQDCGNVRAATQCYVSFNICPSCGPPGSLTTIPPFNPTHCTPGASNSGILTALGCIQTNPGELIGRIAGIVLGLAGGIALLLIIYSGYRMVMAAGNPEALQGARETLTAAIVGLLFIIFSFVILEVIGVDILRLPGFGRSVAPGCEVPETALYNRAGCGFSEGTKNLCYNLDSIPEDQLTEQQQAWRIKCFDEGYLQDNSGILQQCSDLSFAIDRPDICDPATVRMRCSLYRADEYDTYPDTVKALFDKCVANGYR